MTEKFTEKIEGVKKRCDELYAFFAREDSTKDMNEYNELSKEFSSLSPILRVIREYEKCIRDKEGSEEFLTEAKELGGDYYELAREELDALCEREQSLLRELELMLIPPDPRDTKNAIIEIRSGTGGKEAELFVYDLYRMYTMYAQRCGYETDTVYGTLTELGGFKEVVFTVSGRGAFGRYKFEKGAHRVQRVPETEANGKKQTSAVTVAVFPEAEEVDFEINMADLQIDTYRASGAGGQHVNKTESAIRITHIPTGTVVECQDERSQHKNKDKALKVLRSRLLQSEKQKQKDSLDSDRKNQVGSGDRSERIRTYNYHQNRVSDHISGKTYFSLKDILNGDMDELIDNLTAYCKTEQIEV